MKKHYGLMVRDARKGALLTMRVKRELK